MLAGITTEAATSVMAAMIGTMAQHTEAPVLKGGIDTQDQVATSEMAVQITQTKTGATMIVCNLWLCQTCTAAAAN